MNTINSSSKIIGWIIIATGIIGFVSFVFMILFFTIGHPFGTLNDSFIGLTAIMSIWVAWRLIPHYSKQFSKLGFLVAIIGAIFVVLGSIFIIYGYTGYFLSGLYSALGYALIGLWLLGFSFSIRHSNSFPKGIIKFGIVTGIFMAIGLVSIPGIVNGIDSWESAPWYVIYIGLGGSLGWIILYPIWCILMGRIYLTK